MPFSPPCCPIPQCPSSRKEAPFLWRKRGHYVRACDGRAVQRFLCLACLTSFSVQSFRLDYRHRKPHLNGRIFDLFISKVTHRQAARILRTRRRTIERRLTLYGGQARLFQQARLQGKRIDGVFLLDELETFEQNRRLKPVTMPLLIERESRFFVHLETAALPARGPLSAKNQLKKEELERLHGKRRSGSTAAVTRCFEALARHHKEGKPALILTDCKTSYPVILNAVFKQESPNHKRTSSKRKRDPKNPLFAINHSFAMLRDGISRLVRRTWAHSMKRERLAQHAWIHLLWRNFVRGVTNVKHRITPAMAIGIETEAWTRRGLLVWSARFPQLLKVQ